MSEKFNLLEEIENALGVDVAKRLISVYGGMLISVPRKAEGSTMEDDLGPTLAQFLVELRGGESVEVPVGLKYRPAVNRNTVIAHPELSANELARKLGITHTRVRQIRRELRLQKAEAGPEALPDYP